MTQSIILADHLKCQRPLIRKIRYKLSALLLKSGEPQSVIDDVLLAVSEHLSNLAKHSEEAVCEVVWQPQERRLVVRDDGQSIEESLQSAPDIMTTDAPELKESGMGLSLMMTLFPSLTYRVVNTVRLPNELSLPLPSPRLTVAIIDDDPIFLTLLEAYLEADYDSVLFDDPELALSDERLKHASLVLCDLHMPSISGLELREALLKDDSTALIPFVFLTGDESMGSRSNASAFQIDDYLTKPIDKAVLLSTLQRVLMRSNRMRVNLNDQVDQSINQALWPQGPWQFGAVNISYDYVVAERGGGDFLFVQQTSERCRLIVGDIMGHGEQAKFYAFAVKGFISGLAESLSQDTSCSRFLAQLSDVICRSSIMDNTVVTLLVVDIYPDNRIQMCSAGHPSPVLLQPSAQINALNCSGPLPGLTVGAEYQATSLSLQPGETLLLYTDGLFESLLGKEDISALIEVLSAFNYPMGEVPAQFFSNAFKLHRHQLDDDVTLVSVSYATGL